LLAAAIAAAATLMGVQLGNQNASRLIDKQASVQASIAHATNLQTNQRESAESFVSAVNKYALDLEMKVHADEWVGVTSVSVASLLNTDHQEVLREYAGMTINWSEPQVLDRVYLIVDQVNKSIALGVGPSNSAQVLAAQTKLNADVTALLVPIRETLN
jgi:Iap family predicted aminopeptidase